MAMRTGLHPAGTLATTEWAGSDSALVTSTTMMAPAGFSIFTTAKIENPAGAIIVVDVTKAESDPAHSVVAKVPAGCSPVRMAISPAGDYVYVTARNSNAMLAFNTAKL